MINLNKRGVAGPQGKGWGPSTIHGSVTRGNGILNTELYIGRLVWNRQRFVKDPGTGKRVARLNPSADWVIHEVPELRIVDDAQWLAVRTQQSAQQITPTEETGNAMVIRRRPKHLLSGLAKCGDCGGSYTLISKDLLGCATSRSKGTCNNRLNIRRDAL